MTTSRVPVEDLPYVGLLKAVLGYVDTEHYSYRDLTSEIYLNSGGMSFSVTSLRGSGEARQLYRAVCGQRQGAL